jgi:cytochrome c oxidase cbb3-type subunit IV
MSFDVNTLRELATVLCFASFIGIVGWAYARRNRADFDEAAQLPFQQD